MKMLRKLVSLNSANSVEILEKDNAELTSLRGVSVESIHRVKNYMVEWFLEDVLRTANINKMAEPSRNDLVTYMVLKIVGLVAIISIQLRKSHISR